MRGTQDKHFGVTPIYGTPNIVSGVGTIYIQHGFVSKWGQCGKRWELMRPQVMRPFTNPIRCTAGVTVGLMV